MELPDDVLGLVSDYSRPLTRPDWRTLHKMPNLDFHLAIASEVSWNCPAAIYNIVINPRTNYIYELHFFDGYPYVNRVRDTLIGKSYYVTPR